MFESASIQSHAIGRRIALSLPSWLAVAALSCSLMTESGTVPAAPTSAVNRTVPETPTSAVLPPDLGGTIAPPVSSVSIEKGITLGKGILHDVAVSPDGERLAIGSSMGIFVYTVDGLEEVGFWQTAAPVWAIAYSPDGSLLATVFPDGVSALWDAKSMTVTSAWAGHTTSGRILSGPAWRNAVFSKDGRFLITSGDGGTPFVWDVHSGQEVEMAFSDSQFAPLQGLAVSPDGTMLAGSGTGDRLLLWSLVTGTEVAVTFAVNAAYLAPLAAHNQVAFSPRDGLLASPGENDGVVVLRSVPDLEPVYELRGHEANILSMAFSADGGYLVTSSLDGTARIWDMADRRQIQVISGHFGPVAGARFLVDTSKLVTWGTDSTVRLWNAESAGQIGLIEGFTYPLGLAVVAPDGRTMATVGEDLIARLWDIPSGQLKHSIVGVRGGVVFSPDSRQLIAADGERFARRWDVTTGEKLTSLNFFPRINSVAYTPDGRFLVASNDNTDLAIIDLTTEETTVVVESEWPDLLGFQLMADGQSLATNDGTDIIILAVPGGQEIDRFSLDEGSFYSQVVGISPTGAVLAVEARNESRGLVSLQFVDLQTHDVLVQVDTLSDSFNVWAFSQDGKYVALGGHGVLRVLDIEADTTVWSAEFSEWVGSVSFVGEDNKLAVISGDSPSIQFYSFPDGSVIGELPPLTGTVQDFRFFPMAEQLLQYGGNGLIQFWRIR